jgi:hypothetical protein
VLIRSVIFGMLLLLVPTVCSALEPGFYPLKSTNRVVAGKPRATIPESDSEREFHELMETPGVDLWFEAIDKIRIRSSDPEVPIPNPYSSLCTREEAAKCLKDVAHRNLLRVQIDTKIMWGPVENSEKLVRELKPFLNKLGYDRVLIFALKPHDDGQTFMHPLNGMVKLGLYVFKEEGSSGLEKPKQNNKKNEP